MSWASSTWSRLRWVAVAGFLVSGVVAACATGGGTGENETNNSTAGMGGMEEGGTTSMGGMGGGMGGNPSTGGGMQCAEDPCKLTAPQCGCPPGEKCNWANDQRSCIADGTAAVGEACGSTACAAGGHCLNFQGLTMCKGYCDDDSQCMAPGGICVLEVANGGMPFQQKWCSDNCDLASGVGCSPANAKCELGREQTGAQRWFTLCYPQGTGVQGDPCADGLGDADSTLCAKGFSCTGIDAMNNPICLGWCTDPSGGTGCPAGTCSAFDPPVTIGSVQYGACL